MLSQSDLHVFQRLHQDPVCTHFDALALYCSLGLSGNFVKTFSVMDPLALSTYLIRQAESTSDSLRDIHRIYELA